jgi:hypothetical protein
MKKVIKLTESQLKKMVQDTINEQGGATSGYFAVYQDVDNVRLTPTKDPGLMLDKNNKDFVYYIFDTGRIMYKPTTGDKLMGQMSITGDRSYKIVWDNGQVYDSVSGKITDPNEKATVAPQINTINCANQLVDIANDPTKRKILKFGCKTQAVKELQTLLGVFGKDGAPTGYFGKRTKQEVIDFQTKNRLVKKEGIVGPETYKALTPNAVSSPTQDVKEYDDMYDDDDYNELDNLFNKNFDTEDDYDGETLRGDEEGFSNKLRQKHIHKNIKINPIGIGDVSHYHSRKKEIEVPRDEKGKEVKWSPLKSDDLPLNKYLEKKKMGDLDEDEDIAMLDNLLKKD